MNYTNWQNVKNLANQTFPEIGTVEQAVYLNAADVFINNYLGYNAQTTTSGILSESIVREKHTGKIDNYGNLVIDLSHPPVHFDSNYNPLVTLVEFNVGAVSVALNLTDGTGNAKNTVLEVSENRRKVYYPHMYFLPAVSAVTPTAKISLFNLRDVRFWTDISYIGGYDAVPADIVMAATYITLEFAMQRTNPAFLQSMTQGTMTQTFMTRSKTNSGFNLGMGIQTAQSLLQPYVIYTF